jgi:hypothetical protein
MGNARWTGVRLSELLASAAIKPGTVQLQFQGLDRGPGPDGKGGDVVLKSLDVADPALPWEAAWHNGTARWVKGRSQVARLFDALASGRFGAAGNCDVGVPSSAKRACFIVSSGGVSQVIA